MSSDSAPTLEYTCSVCTCGRELSTLYYLLTCREQFMTIFGDYLSENGKKNIGFTTLESIDPESINFCCLMNLRYGIRVPVANITMNNAPDANEIKSKVSGYKYPEGLPGPLSRERTLTWI